MRPTILAVAILTATLPAQEGRRIFQTYGSGIFGAGGYGTAIAVVGDVDGDSFVDIAVGDPFHAPSSGTGIVRIVSGVDGATLRTYGPVAGQQSLGRLLAAPGDVDGDLVPDLLVASSASVQLLSGASGLVLDTYPVAADALAAAGDWNGDLVPDIAWLRNGVVEVVSGWNGTALASLGSAVTSVASVAAIPHGTRRLAVCEPTGITVHAPTGPVWSLPGYIRVDDGGYMDNDLLGDVLATQVGGSNTDVLAGANGAFLLTAPGGACAAGGVDLDGDLVRDLVVGQPLGAPQGRVLACSGVDGSLLFTRRGQEVGEDMGIAVAMHPGAGPTTRPAALIGSFDSFNGSQNAGSLLAVAVAAPGERDGAFRAFGSACNFTFQKIRPGTTLPRIGSTYVFRFDSPTVAGGFEFLIFGVSDSSYGSLPLPLTLPGSSCVLYVSADYLQFPALSPFQSIVIPLQAALIGARIFVQGMNALGFPTFETSDAAELTIGN